MPHWKTCLRRPRERVFLDASVLMSFALGSTAVTAQAVEGLGLIPVKARSADLDDKAHRDKL
jgi:hypothetical protein